MADFILSVAEQASIQLQHDGGPVNDGIKYRVHPGFEHIADVSEAGVIQPKKPGTLLINVLDLNYEPICELAGVIVTSKRFNHQKDLRSGTKKHRLQVVGQVSGLHIGPGLYGSIYTGTVAALPVVSDLRFQRVSGGFRAVFQTDRNDLATYRVDIFEHGQGLSLASGSVTEATYSHAITIPFVPTEGKTYSYRVTGTRASDDQDVGSVVLPLGYAHTVYPPVIITDPALTVLPSGGFTLTFDANRPTTEPYLVQFYRGEELVFSKTYARQGPDVSITENGATKPPLGDYLTMVVSHPDTLGTATLDDIFYVLPGTYPLMPGVVSRPSGAFASSSLTAPSLAFDNDIETAWQDNDPDSTGSYVGNDLGTAETVLAFSFINGTELTGSVESVAIEYADALGGPWSLAGTVSGLSQVGERVTVNLPNSGAHRYWRMVSPTDDGVGTWIVPDLQLSTLAQDNAAVTDEEAELQGFGEGAWGDDSWGDGYDVHVMEVVSVVEPFANALDVVFTSNNPLDGAAVKLELLALDNSVLQSKTEFFTNAEFDAEYVFNYTTNLTIPPDDYRVRLTDLTDEAVAVSEPFSFQAN